MRQELVMLWQRSTATKEQLLSQLEDCAVAAEKKRHCRRYAILADAAPFTRKDRQTKKSPRKRAFYSCD